MRRILPGLSLSLLFAFALFLIPPVSFAWQNGDTIYVDKNATGNGSGVSWGNAFKSIKGAILSVSPGTQVSIFVSQGVYYENNLVLSEGIKLYGSFEGHESSLAERRDVWTNDHWTVIDAERKHRVLNMKDKTEVNGFILRNGLRDYTLQSNTTLDDSRGGGIYIECDDDVVVRNNIIEHCSVFWQGGGIFIEGNCNRTSAAPLIEFNVIRSCTGYCGGGIEIAGVPEGAPGGTDAIIRHNVLRNNPDGGTSELGFGLELWTEYDDQCSPRMGDFYNNIIIGFHNQRDWNIDAADVWVWARNSADRSFISQEWYLGDYLYNGCYKFGNPNKQNIFGSNPMFIDEANSNYRLRSGSPCIGTGRGGVNIGLFPYNNGDPGDTQPPQISNVSSGGIASTSATIIWSTNEPANSQVEYGLDTSYGSVTNLDLALVTSHEASLEGLQSGTTYHYRVRSADGRGNTAVSEDFQFTTLSGALLSDDFSGASLDLDKWVKGSHAGNTSTVQSGALRLRTTTSGSSGWVYTKSNFSGSQKTIQVKVVQPNDDGCLGMSPTVTTSALTGLYTEPTWYRFYNYRSGSSEPYQLYVQWKRNGQVNGLDVATGVNFTANFYLRLRTDASKIYFEYSFDNIAWTAAYSEVFNLTGYTLNDLYFFELTAYSTASKGEWVVDDFAIYSTASSDTSAPVISSVASSSVTSSGATITWSTNEPADTQVEYGLTTGYGSLSPLNSTLTQNHSVTLSGLSSNTAYHYRVKSKDAAGNLAVSGDYAFTTAPAPDTQAPTVPAGLTATAVSSTQINLSWAASTDNVGVTGYRIYRDGNQITTTAGTSYQDTGRSPSTTHTYRVAAYDAAGNISAQSSQVSATTPAPLDTQPPVISVVSSSGITSNGATVTWTTSEASDSQVEYGLTTGYGSSTPLNTSLVTNHSVTLSGLSASTAYHYRVKSKDAAGNLAVSGDYTFTTAPAPDTQPPVISSVASSSVTSSGATISWSTNEPADTQVEYGLTTGYGSLSLLNSTLTQNHSVTLSGLSANTAYHYRVKSKDAAGNLAVSGDYTFTTLSGALLSDDFSGASLDLNKWVKGSHAGNTSTVQSGALRLRTSTSNSSGWVYTKNKFSGSQKTIQVKVVQPNNDGCLGMSPTVTTSALTGFYTQPTWYRFYNYRSGSSGPYKLYVQWKRNGQVNGLDVATGVNFTGNFYLRLRTDASKIYFEYSFNNIAWTTAYSEVFNLPGYTLNSLFFFELAGYSTASKGEWVVDDFAIY